MIVGESLRAARRTAGISLSLMAARTHYSKSYLSLVENGRRAATTDVVDAYERVLGVGGLGEDLDRREFFRVTGLVAANVKVASDLTASLASNDPGPLTEIQTSHGVDLAVATLADRATLAHLRRWLDEGVDPVLRVNAAGILAKVPGQSEASRVTDALGRDAEIRNRYMTAVVARVCGIDWSTAARLTQKPTAFRQPGLAARRFADEAVNDRDAGARWCSAAMLQALSPLTVR